LGNALLRVQEVSDGQVESLGLSFRNVPLDTE
jgi:hypothetical protein